MRLKCSEVRYCKYPGRQRPGGNFSSIELIRCSADAVGSLLASIKRPDSVLTPLMAQCNFDTILGQGPSLDKILDAFVLRGLNPLFFPVRGDLKIQFLCHYFRRRGAKGTRIDW